MISTTQQKNCTQINQWIPHELTLCNFLLGISNCTIFDCFLWLTKQQIECETAEWTLIHSCKSSTKWHFYPKWLLIERKFRCFTNCNATHHFNDADNSHTRLKNTTHRALVEKNILQAWANVKLEFSSEGFARENF